MKNSFKIQYLVTRVMEGDPQESGQDCGVDLPGHTRTEQIQFTNLDRVWVEIKWTKSKYYTILLIAYDCCGMLVVFTGIMNQVDTFKVMKEKCNYHPV
jgi:hypothetical protein